MRVFCVVLLLFATGCAAGGGAYYTQSVDGVIFRTTSLYEANRVLGEFQPVGYRVGYMQGCDSGHFSEGNRLYQNQKDEVRYGADPLYRQGWDFGYLHCKDKYVRASRYANTPGYSPFFYYPRFYFGFSHGYGYGYRHPRHRHGYGYGFGYYPY